MTAHPLQGGLAGPAGRAGYSKPMVMAVVSLSLSLKSWAVGQGGSLILTLKGHAHSTGHTVRVAGGHRARAFSYPLSGRKDIRSRRCLICWDMRKAHQRLVAMALLCVHAALA